MDNLIPERIGAVLRGQLSTTFKSGMPDARNYEESPHAETMSYKKMAEDVVCFLDNNGLERIIFLGHSMGGKTAMQVALRFSDRVSCLIVVDIAPVQYQHFQKNIKLIRAMQELDLPKKMTRAEVEKKLAYKIDEKHILSFLMTNLICKKGQSQWRIGLEQIASGLQVLLNYLNPENTFSGPTLFLVVQISIISRLNITNRSGYCFLRAVSRC